MHRADSATTPDVQVTTRGELPPGSAEYATKKIGKRLRFAHRPVLAVRVRLSRHGDPAVDRPVVAQANLDVDGRPVRAQAVGATATESIDRLDDKVRHLLERAALHWEARRGGRPAPGAHEWRHGSVPARRPEYFPRPETEREIIRHKSYSLHRRTVDEAAFDMHLLDYEFHLFTEAGTGQDSVLYHAGQTLHRLAQLTPPGPHQLAPFKLALTISQQPAPLLSTAESVDRLALTGLPFLFFLDAERGRGSVLYHRYDGHYGLITPSA
ncbi:HPF/RaiA family ribosome-associated protein [Amycolatopsis sp. NPDC059657]|uniref:ribosome hibernation promotion factor n=1 Tax=Amycolatopsis sp. NPDC059657 TaxID=3346899 RepID=UPI00366D88C6